MTSLRPLRLICALGVAAFTLAFGACEASGQRSANGGVAADAGGECPAGTTEVRPGNCRAPDLPVPSILDYRPRSTVVAAETYTPRAKFPVVDFHGHAGNLAAPGRIDGMVKELDALNIRTYIAADNLQGDRLRQTLAALKAHPQGDRFRVLAGIDFRNVDASWGARAAAQLKADIEAGAVGVGEIPKSFGMDIRKPDGSRLAIDDPQLDPVWEMAAQLGIPIFIHTAEPPEFFQPMDMQNERWLELALFPDRRRFDDPVTFEQLLAERDNLFRRHPRTTFVAAHLGWHGNDFARAARLLDEFPNVYYELGAILYDLGRQPRAAREFFIRYQDRILFGKDSFQPSEYPYYWRVLETADEYFDYYRDYHAFWKLYGMELPDEVLRKVYAGNADRLLGLGR